MLVYGYWTAGSLDWLIAVSSKSNTLVYFFNKERQYVTFNQLTN